MGILRLDGIILKIIPWVLVSFIQYKIQRIYIHAAEYKVIKFRKFISFHSSSNEGILNN
jgi:hypothetical protein